MEKVIQGRYWRSPRGLTGVQWNKHKVNLVRYADDFIVTADTKETAEEVKTLIIQFLQERGLELSEEKTEITHITKGFDFLGWNFRKYKGKLLVKASRKSIRNILEKIRNTIHKNCMSKQIDLINILNPIIRGWCNYHNHVVSDETFKTVDTFVNRCLICWARRRHPEKSMEWIKARYWQRFKNRDWIFTTENRYLRFAADTKIRRHNLVRLTANPFIPEDRRYLQDRKKTRRA